jgi:16S rRNA (guanine527-N7)-methyltransferase
VRASLPDTLESVSRETAARLGRFAELLGVWNRRVNLTSARDLAVVWRRHIADSLQVVPLLADGGSADAADIGSGPGFPGLVVAIATGRHVHLIEADRRKAAFLREAARETAAPVTIHAVRAETLAGSLSVGCILARAVAPLPRLLELGTPLLAPGGACVFLKGARTEDELTAAREQWHMRVESFPSKTDPHGRILRIRDIRRHRNC